MNGRFWRFAAALLPICFLSAQQRTPQAPQQPNLRKFPQPSPEEMRKAAELRQQIREQAIAANQLAGHIQSLDDARKLVDMVGGDYSQGLAHKWGTRSMRELVARAEFASAAEGALIPEQRVADAWNDYLEKVGAPQEYHVSAEEIHTLRDMKYVSSQVLWARGSQSVWTVPNIYAVGADGKAANGCRAVEVLSVLWQLRSQPQILESIRELVRKGERWSDMVKNPSKPPAPGTAKGYLTARVAPPNPVQQAAYRYVDEHGARALNHAIEGLLKDLFVG
ncbi:MAG TPA: hypothetical protein VGR47_05305 [Terracidiphilus sp.]|nr:hypothetical protein [Terracidiphilus sp.]